MAEQTQTIFHIVKVANVYLGTLALQGQNGGYYAISDTRMKVITKLLTYAKLDGHIK